MNRTTCLSLSVATVIGLVSVAASAEPTNEPKAPFGPDDKKDEAPLTLVVGELQRVHPPETNAELAATDARVAPPSTYAGEVILLPEFVVRGEQAVARRAHMLEQLGRDLRRLEATERVDLVRGGTVVAKDFGDARLTVGNDERTPGFSLLNLEF